MTLIEFMHFLWWIGILQRIPLANGNEFFLDEYEEIKPITSKFIRSPNYGDVSMLQTYIDFTKLWKFVTPEGYMLKITFLHIGLCPPVNETFTGECSSGIFVYDGKEAHDKALSMELYGQDWATQPIFFSSGNFLSVAYVASFTAVHNHYAGFLAVVESVNVLPLPYTLLQCNETILINEDQILHFSNNNFLQPYGQQYGCTVQSKIQLQSNWKGYSELTFLSLSIDPGYVSQQHGCQFKLNISYHEAEHGQLAYAQFCGHSPPKAVLKFIISFSIHLQIGNGLSQQGFSVAVRLKYCPPEMVWDSSYCSNHCNLSCQDIKNQNIIGKKQITCPQSCYNDCRCPEYKPFWDLNRCVAVDECINTEEILKPENTKFESETGEDFDKDSIPVVKTLSRKRRSSVYIFCKDKTDKPGFCSLQRALGHCSWHAIMDKCVRTCDKCGQSERWDIWSAWSTCSRDCDGGKQLRAQSCVGCESMRYETKDCSTQPCTLDSENQSNDYSNDNMAPSLRSYWRADNTTLLPKSRQYTGSGFGNERDNKEFKCGANEFLCTNRKCIPITKKCNGYYECTDHSDEPGTCLLGHRLDGRRCIINWATHKCIDTNETAISATIDEDVAPWAFRRCPGQQSPELERYWWTYNIFGNLKHLQSNRCLHCNVSDTNFTVLLKPCDIFDPHQQWICVGLHVRLKYPHRVLPRTHYHQHWLAMSVEGPGKYMEMVEQRGPKTTEFHILETDKLSICSGRGGGYVLPSFCTKTCGNGTIRVLRSCAKYGQDCNGGDKYEYVPCNTKPCPFFCPPSWSVMKSENNTEDVNCFKAFNTPKTYKEAQAFCAANNWTLAADKNKQTHKFILNLQSGVVKSYIGVYEDLAEPADGPPSHALRYDYDRQPIGGFQPWRSYGVTDHEDLPGCILGRGGAYYGSKSSAESFQCDKWGAAPDHFQQLTQLVPSYYEVTRRNNLCRNPNLDPSGLWCYTKNDKKLKHRFCSLPDCLDTPSEDDDEKAFPEIDSQHIFLIRSRLGGYWSRKWCLAAPPPGNSKDYAKPLPCDLNNEFQQFFWWSSTSLVNRATLKCLTLEKGPPEHGGRLVFASCDRRKSHSLQAWNSVRSLLLSGWKPDGGTFGTQHRLYKVVYDKINQKVYLSDMRHSLFVARSEKIGMVRMSTLFSRAPVGTYVFIQGCGGCLTNDVRKGFDLTYVGPCSQEHLSQRWVILGNGRLMNSESGKCLASFIMQAYAITVHCDDDDISQKWKWKAAIGVDLKTVKTTTLMHVNTQFYLSCGCAGLSSTCLLPTNQGANLTWLFLPHASKNTPAARINSETRATSRGVLGYSFVLQSSANLTKCAIPQVKPSKSGENAESENKIVFLPCKLEDTGFLWWFSGLTTQIKHRGLDLCLDADLKENDNDFEESEIQLRPCSISRLDFQSWIFTPGPNQQDPNELPGEYIHLASNNSYMMSIKLLQNSYNQEDFVLVLQVENNKDKWEALTLSGNKVGISEMIDCALPWAKMSLYKGDRSWTRYGYRCQPWNSQMPHRHPFDPKSYSEPYLTANKCRRPRGEATDILDDKSEDHVWCMTLKPDVRWQDCLVSRCPLPAVVSLTTASETWEVSLGEEALPFTCQTPGECYYDVGESFSGYTNYTSREYCMNWRKYHNGDRSFPDHARCRNPNRSFMKPWCYVRKNVPQYCDTIKQCVVRCKSPFHKLHKMKIASISYLSPSHMYAAGSKIQVVCKEGYRIKPFNAQEQVIQCQPDGTWKPALRECRRITCPNPVQPSNARLLTVRSRYLFGSKVAYQCREGHLIAVGQTTIEITCLGTGEWSDTPYKCLPACPEGWISFNMSCYTTKSHHKNYNSYKDANDECGKNEGGGLAVPTDKITYDMIKWLVQKNVGQADFLYWLGIKDVAASQNALQAREWKSQSSSLLNIEVFRDDLLNYHQFQIRSYGSAIKREERFAYTDRCMYGDRATRKVYTKSCSFENATGLHWSWITYDHLYNVDLGLCLTAMAYDGSNGEEGVLTGSVRLENCSFGAENQSFTCGPHSGYLLKLRKEGSSFIAIAEDDPDGEVVVGGKHATGPRALWHSYPDATYLCHWVIKPPDTYFIVHRDRSPSFTSFTAHELHKCIQNRTGAKLVSRSEITTVGLTVEKLNWCACLYMLNDQDEVISAASVQDDACALPDDVSYVTSPGITLCKTKPIGDSLCNREDGSSPSQKPVPNWCLTLSVTSRVTSKVEPRFCSTPIAGHVCHAKARWSCTFPFQPPNSMPFMESGNFNNMAFSYGSKIPIRCKKGYRFPGDYSTVTIKCNEFLKWELIKTMRDDEIKYYVSDRKERERALYNLACKIITCSTPPEIPGMSLEVNSNTRGLFNYGTNATYTCLPGTHFAPGDNQHTVTCSHDKTWQKTLSKEKKCVSMVCDQPADIEHADLFVTALVFTSPAVYTCKHGYWFQRNQKTLKAVCNGKAVWEPNPQNASCVPVTCITPSDAVLSKIIAEQAPPKQLMNIFKSKLIIRCLPGYWFDREVFTAEFNCGATGKWEPFPPNKLQCVPVYCRRPEPVPGAILYGSDAQAGRHVRYQCAPTYWIRRAFKLFSPHWGLCLRVVGGADPLFFTPLNRYVEGSSPMMVTLNPDCNGFATSRDLWVWHWSFHIRNRFTDTCLTATALPTLKEDAALVTVEKCDRNNVYQHWRCSLAKDGSNARLLSLRIAKRGAYLTTIADEHAFWSGKGDVQLVVTGDNFATGVESYWQVYGIDFDSVVDICMLREGHVYEEAVCNSYGRWMPDPYSLECTLVDCGPPPEIPGAISELKRSNFSDYLPSHFAAPNIWEHSASSYAMKNYSFPVFTISSYQCNVGKWVIKHKYSLSMICRENGLWQERKSEKFITDANLVDTDLSCTDVVCPAPKVLPLSVALVTPTSMQKYADGEPVLSYQGYVVYAAGVNQTYRPVYNSSVLMKCDPGFWILNENLTNVPAFSRNAGLNGSTSIHATCDANGNWSDLVVHKTIECVPVTCSDPGNVQTARRFPESVRDPIYGYGTIFQYQCNSGFWFSPARIYTEIKCNESGLWNPDPKMLACIEVRCSDPGPVNFAKRSGNDFSVQGQVIFTCGTGRLIGRKVKSLTSICQPDGFWFPPPSSIRCELLICDPLPIIPHGTFSNSSKVRRHEFIAGDETILSCDDSYTIDSSSSSIKYFCDLNGAWYPDPAILIDGRPRCEPVHCPSPPDILSSDAIQRGAADTYRHGDEVRYVCPLGKLIEASVPQLAKQTVCVTERNLNPLINSGQSYKVYWDPAVSTINCTDLLCSRPGLIEHSTVTVRGFEYLAKTSYVCHTGYMLNSTFASKFQTSFQSVCQYDALWFPNPALVQCVPVECADPGDIRDSTRFKDSRLAPPYYFNDVVTYKCIQGKHFVYLNENSKSSHGQWLWKIKCLFDGTWDMLPSNAYVTCQDITCRAPRFIPKAYIATSYREFVAPSHYPLHSVYNITCSLGYVSSSTGLQHTSLTCGKYGQWEPVVPSSMSCERIHCHDPGNRNHSTRVVHGFQLNDRITYFADDGYASLGFPVGDPRSIVTLECGITGEWHVHNFANLSSEGDYMSRSKRNVPLFRTPYSILNLTETHITFDVAKCAHPKVSNNITEPSHIVAEYDVGSVLYLSCIPLHFVTINITTFSIMCTKRGEWWPLPSNMKCLPASEFFCNLPIPPANATIELDSYRLEETATITCLAGFEIRPGISKELIICKKDHVWSPKDGVNCSQIVCDPPPDINNAELEQSGTVYGSMAFYKCQPGYSFTQLANDTTFTSVCLAMNTWSPSPFGLSCQPVNCGTPDDLVLPNTISLNYNSTLYASVANFTCQDGFVMESSNGTVSTSITAWCGIDGHWTLSRSGMMNSSALPDEGSYCEIGSCDNPPNVENAHVTLIGGTNHNASALYRCVQGYRVDPPGERSKNKTFVAKCGVDGNWTTSLTSSNEEYKCVKAKCPHLQNQPNAYIAYTNDDINNNYAGGTASHSCNDGYTTVMGRSFTLRCMWYGEWEPPQDSTPCIRLQCSAAPEMENAIGAGDDAAGGSWTYTCDSGYEISSTESSVTMECSGQALWVPHYTLLQKCRRVSCPSPDLYPKNAEAYMEDGTKIDPRRDDYYIEADTIVQFKCILGFWTKSMQIQSQNVTCQVTRTYSPQLVNLDDCEPLSCSNPPQITGATLSNTNSGTYFYNSTARYTCPSGTYFPSEKKKSVEIHCNEFGVFEPNPASLSCEIVNCDDYMMPNADRITLTSLAENGQATYRCHSGAWYERGVQERTYVCNDDGRWEPDIMNINCKTIICYVTQTGYTTLQNGEQVNAGESLYVRCKGGYYLVGPGTINCQNDGTFAKDPSTLCKPVECPDPPIPNNADASSTEFEYGNPIVITCSTGYWLSRGTLSLTLNCLGSGRWDDDSSKMVCVPVSCLLPPAPKHGAVDGDGTKYKAKISVKCDEGFWLDDASKALSADVVCESDGEWSRKIPEACSKIVCPNPPSLPHSKVTEDQKTGYKAITYYICMSLRWVAYNNKTHWVLSSEKEGKSTCSETGDWDPMPDEDFRCNSIYDGDLLINGALTKSPSGKSYTGDQGGPPYYKLIRRIPAEWLKFDEEIMTLSDAYFPPNKSSISDQRDIKFIWDQNPLTFWIAPSAVNEISSNDSGSFWSVEYLLVVTKSQRPLDPSRFMETPA
ncbi:unnamed protein product [Clavelina lepadiformis]|uniref:Uncharacterized protein n=1 Tax=Clavelina lepadiformis TaxID=159417 RepID=A0ABP0F847_CLALP